MSWGPAPPRVRMRLEVQLAPPPIGYVGVQLRRREVRMSEHLLDRPEVGAALEQVRRKRVAKQVRVHACRVEAGLLGAPLEDEERAGACERAALRVQEELGAMTPVEVRASAGEVAPKRVYGLSPDRHDPFLVAFADAADEPLVQRDRRLLERDSL